MLAQALAELAFDDGIGILNWSSTRSKIANCGGIPPLVSLMKNGTNNAKLQATIAIKNMAITYVSSGQQNAIADAGAVSALMSLL
jgi:hypothetical protein